MRWLFHENSLSDLKELLIPFIGSNLWLGGVPAVPGLRVEACGTLKSKEESGCGSDAI